ncbi:MAG: sugar ABC transporter substrate-binding protein [Spirochaetaceae bacterium]|nr:MAG: sugar ABC transporter substrate-binding protein [Spirochaetaceae bacterium]
MKKWVWLILVFLLASISWAAPQKEPEEVTLEWMQWMYGDDAKIYAGVIEEFQAANPKIKVSITEFSYQDHYSNLEVRMAGDNAPDIFRNEYGFVMRYEKNDQVVDLKPYFPSNYWNRFWPKLMEFCDIGGGVYGMPQMTDTTVVFYNKDLFKKAGVTAPTRVQDAWDWDDWEAIGRKLKAAGAKYGMAGATYGGTVWYYVSWGGGFVSPDGSKPYMNQPGVIEGLKRQKKWFDEELEPISTLWFNPDNFEVLFSQGQIGMIWSGIWMTTFMDQNVKDFDWGVTFCPGGPGGFGLHLGGCVNSISNQSDHVEEAAKFLEFFTREKSMDTFCQQGYIPADVDLAESIVYKNPAVAKTMKVANEAYGELSPMIVTQYKAPNLYSMYQATMEDLGPYFLGQVGVNEAVAKLEKDIADIMKQ